jgi:hypothetical protein
VTVEVAPKFLLYFPNSTNLFFEINRNFLSGKHGARTPPLKGQYSTQDDNY